MIPRKTFIFSVVFILAIISSCQRDNLINESDSETLFDDNANLISRNLHVQSPLNSSSEDRCHLGYWLDSLPIARSTSMWGKFIMVAVFDKETLQPWHSQEHGDFGHSNYFNSYAGVNDFNFYFRSNSLTDIDSLISFIHAIPDSNYVLLYTFRGNYCSNSLSNNPISQDFENMLTSSGANVDSLKNYPNNWPYILLFKKGLNTTAKESFYSQVSSLDFITLDAILTN